MEWRETNRTPFCLPFLAVSCRFSLRDQFWVLGGSSWSSHLGTGRHVPKNRGLFVAAMPCHIINRWNNKKGDQQTYIMGDDKKQCHELSYVIIMIMDDGLCHDNLHNLHQPSGGLPSQSWAFRAHRNAAVLNLPHVRHGSRLRIVSLD